LVSPLAPTSSSLPHPSSCHRRQRCRTRSWRRRRISLSFRLDMGARSRGGGGVVFHGGGAILWSGGACTSLDSGSAAGQRWPADHGGWSSVGSAAVVSGLIWAQMGLGGPQPCDTSCIVAHFAVFPGIVLWHEGTWDGKSYTPLNAGLPRRAAHLT
jgi:hypothetical protein